MHTTRLAMNKMILIGGSGFIGSHIARTALRRGWNVVIASRSGVSDPSASWAADPKVTVATLDALNRPQILSLLETHSDTRAIVNTIGLLTTDAPTARRQNGDPMINIVACAQRTGYAGKFVFVSAASIYPIDKLLFRGYYYGKRQGERALEEYCANRSVILQPGLVYGNRYVASIGMSLPIGVVGAPLELAMLLPYRMTHISMLTPPISVKTLSKAAVHACEEEELHGTWKYDDICREAHRLH